MGSTVFLTAVAVVVDVGLSATGIATTLTIMLLSRMRIVTGLIADSPLVVGCSAEAVFVEESQQGDVI